MIRLKPDTDYAGFQISQLSWGDWCLHHWNGRILRRWMNFGTAQWRLYWVLRRRATRLSRELPC